MYVIWEKGSDPIGPLVNLPGAWKNFSNPSGLNEKELNEIGIYKAIVVDDAPSRWHKKGSKSFERSGNKVSVTQQYVSPDREDVRVALCGEVKEAVYYKKRSGIVVNGRRVQVDGLAATRYLALLTAGWEPGEDFVWWDAMNKPMPVTSAAQLRELCERILKAEATIDLAGFKLRDKIESSDTPWELDDFTI